MALRRARIVSVTAASIALLVPLGAQAASAGPPAATPANGASPATAVGYGGAVATVDADATRVGLDVLRRGGNAADAAVAAAAALGVTEPFSSGLGGGGFFVYYDARTRTVHTIDGRESAPQSMHQDAFVNPATGQPYDFQQARVSGISAGVPGSPLTWDAALRQWGTISLSQALRPAIGLARDGFTVDSTFRGQVSDNFDAFGRFSSTSQLYLPGGQPPAVGSTFRNPDLANTYQLIARDGIGVMYRGPVARDIVTTINHPPVAATPIGNWPFPVLPGTTTTADLARYGVRYPAPTHMQYRGLDVYGMATPSSGGSTVGEALNILGNDNIGGMSSTEALHHYLEASALSFADRNRYVGDGTPRALLDQLLTPGFAKERACLIDPAHALAKPVAPGNPDGSYHGCPAGGTVAAAPDNESHTTNLTVADKWGNVAEYTLTIEQIGGNAMVVPGRGFLLNNELTDFNFTPTQGTAFDPNLPAPGKQPRSSMSPTILLRHGQPYLAIGSPGGSTIITTVLQILMNRLDLGMTLPQAIAAPRATQRNTPTVLGEPAFLALPEAAGLRTIGHVLENSPEIGAATGVEFLTGGRILAAAEPVRRGVGSAGVVFPSR
jgi:gamma-glutamyltranspeptidase/glutathione hydrolase